MTDRIAVRSRDGEANSACLKCRGHGELCSGPCDLRLVAGAPIPVPHPIEACYGSHLHCHWHDVDEPGDPFRVCFECHHAFLSAAELLAGHNKHLAIYGDGPETDVDRVFCCPFCIHDW